MDLKSLQEQWNDFGLIDPLWSILTWPDKKHRQWNTREFFNSGQKEIEEVLFYLNSVGLKIGKDTALDFGCGIGRLTQSLAKHFIKTHGIDIAPSMIRLANSYNNFPGTCFYNLNSTDNLKIFKNDTFDFIYTRLTLQHMEPRYVKSYIKEFIRILKPTGLLIFQEPSHPTIQQLNETKKISEKHKIRTFIKKMVPISLLDVYHKTRAKITKDPIMELYGINKGEIELFLKENNAKIVDVKENADAGPEWVSYRYCVVKN